MDDTICAISTALGVGGISIIRVSGDDSIKIVNTIFKGKNLEKVESHTINYGHIIYKEKIIDEVLVSIMKAPKTYTMEDIVEINLHGGIATTNKVLEILLSIGCRLAEPGEFTKRAFLNGRIDLVEAEAVSDIIEAESENARSLSINQISGKLSDIIKDIRKTLIDLEANIEVNIDYPEYEDIEDITVCRVKTELKDISAKFQKLIEESQNGKIIKNGINIAIVGKPNVGKSSILNFLLEEEKAIVTNIPGTTRDIVEGKIILNGTVVNFIDTAGIRETDNIVEKIGVDKSFEQIDAADLILFVLNNNEIMDEEDSKLLEKIKSKKHLIFINKSDLDKKINIDEDVIIGNTVQKDGLDELKNKISEMFSLEELPKKDFTYISNARQLALVKQAKDSIDSAIQSANEGLPVDVIEIDLTDARDYLGEIIGDTYKDELLDKLFSRFCLGK